MTESYTPHGNANIRGYLSEEHKRRFTIMAGVLGAVFFLAQFALPFVLMLVMMPTMMLFQSEWMQLAEPRTGAWWNNRLWYVTQAVGGPMSSSKARLQCLDVESGQEANEIAELDIDSPMLLAGIDRLWVLSSASVGYYQDGALYFEPATKQLGDISRPFLYEGRPAVIEKTSGGFRWATFEHGDWHIQQILALGEIEERSHNVKHYHVVTDGDVIHVFARFGSTLYYRQGLPVEGPEKEETWQVITSVQGDWFATVINGTPAVFHSGSPQGFTSTILGFRQTEHNWERFFSHPASLVTQIGVFPRDSSFYVVTQSFPGSLHVFEANDSEVVKDTRFGRSTPLPRGTMALMMFPHIGTLLMPLVLALILSSLMCKYRVCTYASETTCIPFASLMRRAVAQIIDAGVLLGPGVVGFLMLMPIFSDFEKMFSFGGFRMLAGFGMISAGFGWLFLCVLVFSLLEGRYGRTPGKWIVGIKVLGTDLQPCGFGRALVRNLLKCVDGFFNFMVGVMIVALNENWQRVGDMAARTVVIDARHDEAVGPAGIR